MSIQPASLFSQRWDVFWGTTYSFELELFDEYLFRRLGDPPLNATVLVDFTTLARTWDAIQPGEEWRVQRVNRLYLVRSAGSSQGRFHPKTYFFANAKEGSLLVGSGNLSLLGLEEGHEIFCRFDSPDAEGLAVILSWRGWMQRLVEERQDDVLHQRWIRLRQTTREWLRGQAKASAFVTNAESSLLDQLLAGVNVPTDEVHVTAPFFDRDAEALDTLLERARPKIVFLYLGRGTSVEGRSLRKVLDRSQSRAVIQTFDPPRFVHAKMIALINRKRARLLSGSANLSRAALTSNLNEHGWANVEAGVLADTTADTIRDLFHPPRLDLQPLSLDSLSEFSFEEAESPLSVPIRLLSARPADDGSVELSFSGKDVERMFLASGSISVSVKASRTVAPFRLGDAESLVWLTDEDGKVLSNRVPVDDPAALRNQLEARTSKASDRPRELDASDMQSPIARILARLHNEFIFDLDELDSVKQAERANEADASETESSDFWERLAREELQMDPRAGGYRRFGGQALFEGDEVLLLLRMMLDRTPEQRHARLGSETPVVADIEPTPGVRWAPTQRLQVRLMNVLVRWARALADPRMNWLQPLSSVRNFQALLYAVAELWELKALSETKVKAVAGLLLGSFVRSEEADGYLFQISEQEREEALRPLSQEARDVATALVYLGLRPKTAWEDNIFEWQVWLTPCLEACLVSATDEAARLASRIGGEAVTLPDLSDRLRWAHDYIDDPRWCLKMQRLCGLDGIRFSKERFKYELVLEADADGDLVDHPGVVKLIRSALDFRRADGIVIMAGPERVAVRLGERAVVRTKNLTVKETRDRVTETSLSLLEESGLPLREAFVLTKEELVAP